MRGRAQVVLDAMRGATRSSGSWVKLSCPFCPDVVGKTDRGRAFGVNVETGRYHCFRCGTAGRLPASDVGEVEELPERAPPDTFEMPEFAALWEEPAASALCYEPAREYLLGRGIPPALWREARVGACLTGKYAYRVVVPILDDDGAWRGFSARAWVRAERRYLFPFGMDRSRLLYNQRALHAETDRPVLVVEGVFDALALWPDAVAVLGTPSPEQREALLLSRRPVAVVLDGDAWEVGLGLAMRLRVDGARAGAVRLPPCTDPDEVSRDAVLDAARRCVSSDSLEAVRP